MNDAESKLEKCFLVVFPELSRTTVREANTNNVAGWDSLAHITLLSLIGEEFDMSIDFEDFEDALSFPDILARVQAHISSG